MNLDILLFGQLRELAGVSKTTVTMEEESRLSELVRRLGEMHGNAFSQKLNGIEGLRILINGYEYSLLDGMETHLKKGDTVVFLPPVFGG